MIQFIWYALLATLVVGIQTNETDHQQEIRKIETGIDQLIYRIIKLENEIDARRTPDKARGYKSLSYRVSTVEGTGCREDFFQCGGNDPQCVNNLLVCDGLKDCRNGADEVECSLPFKAGDRFDGVPLYHDCIVNIGLPIDPHFIVDSVEVAGFFKPIAKVQLSSPYNDGENTLFAVSSGVYNFATGILEVVWDSLDSKFGWYVNFKDHIILVTYGESDAICGKATFSLPGSLKTFEGVV
jgi:hypothetical protein